MLHNRQGRMIVMLLVLILAAAAAGIIAHKPNPAAAQMPPGMEAPPPPESGDVDGMQPPPRRWNTPGPMMPGGMRAGSAAITAAGEYIYVVQGNTLYQFSARTLKLVNRTEFGLAAGSNVPGGTP